GRITFDLLPKPIYMGLKRVGGNARIIAPYFLQKNVPCDNLLIGPVEIFYDRGFLFRQPNLPAALVDHKLLRWLESVGADREGRVFALLVLAKLGASTRQQDGEAEWL